MPNEIRKGVQSRMNLIIISLVACFISCQAQINVGAASEIGIAVDVASYRQLAPTINIVRNISDAVELKETYQIKKQIQFIGDSRNSGKTYIILKDNSFIGLRKHEEYQQEESGEAHMVFKRLQLFTPATPCLELTTGTPSKTKPIQQFFQTLSTCALGISESMSVQFNKSSIHMPCSSLENLQKEYVALRSSGKGKIKAPEQLPRKFSVNLPTFKAVSLQLLCDGPGMLPTPGPIDTINLRDSNSQISDEKSENTESTLSDLSEVRSMLDSTEVGHQVRVVLQGNVTARAITSPLQVSGPVTITVDDTLRNSNDDVNQESGNTRDNLPAFLLFQNPALKTNSGADNDDNDKPKTRGKPPLYLSTTSAGVMMFADMSIVPANPTTSLLKSRPCISSSSKPCFDTVTGIGYQYQPTGSSTTGTSSGLCPVHLSNVHVYYNCDALSKFYSSLESSRQDATPSDDVSFHSTRQYTLRTTPAKTSEKLVHILAGRLHATCFNNVTLSCDENDHEHTVAQSYFPKTPELPPDTDKKPAKNDSRDSNTSPVVPQAVQINPQDRKGRDNNPQQQPQIRSSILVWIVIAVLSVVLAMMLCVSLYVRRSRAGETAHHGQVPGTTGTFGIGKKMKLGTGKVRAADEAVHVAGVGDFEFVEGELRRVQPVHGGDADVVGGPGALKAAPVSKDMAGIDNVRVGVDVVGQEDGKQKRSAGGHKGWLGGLGTIKRVFGREGGKGVNTVERAGPSVHTPPTHGSNPFAVTPNALKSPIHARDSITVQVHDITGALSYSTSDDVHSRNGAQSAGSGNHEQVVNIIPAALAAQFQTPHISGSESTRLLDQSAQFTNPSQRKLSKVPGTSSSSARDQHPSSLLSSSVVEDDVDGSARGSHQHKDNEAKAEHHSDPIQENEKQVAPKLPSMPSMTSMASSQASGNINSMPRQQSANMPPAPPAHAGATGASAMGQIMIPDDVADQCDVAISGGGGAGSGGEGGKIYLKREVGRGGYGVVYEGRWKQVVVAVKVIIFEDNYKGAVRQKQSAILETAITTSMIHPNVVQTYAYHIQRMGGASIVGDGSTLGFGSTAGGVVVGSATAAEDALYKIYLIQEYCSQGSLADSLRLKRFWDTSADTADLAQICHVISDVAKGMSHIHQRNIIHGDLKCSNVLIKRSQETTSPNGGKRAPHHERRVGSFSPGAKSVGFSAKVADFGLSVKLPHDKSHVSNYYGGTYRYTAPEVVTSGKLSKASDVYAFGVIMWELFHNVLTMGNGGPDGVTNNQKTSQWRQVVDTFPNFPLTCPLPFALLCAMCLYPNPANRPTFEEITDVLRYIVTAVSRGDVAISESNSSTNTAFSEAVGQVEKLQALTLITKLCENPDTDILDTQGELVVSPGAVALDQGSVVKLEEAAQFTREHSVRIAAVQSTLANADMAWMERTSTGYSEVGGSERGGGNADSGYGDQATVQSQQPRHHVDQAAEQQKLSQTSQAHQNHNQIKQQHQQQSYGGADVQRTAQAHGAPGARVNTLGDGTNYQLRKESDVGVAPWQDQMETSMSKSSLDIEINRVLAAHGSGTVSIGSIDTFSSFTSSMASPTHHQQQPNQPTHHRPTHKHGEGGNGASKGAGVAQTMHNAADNGSNPSNLSNPSNQQTVSSSENREYLVHDNDLVYGHSSGGSAEQSGSVANCQSPGRVGDQQQDSLGGERTMKRLWSYNKLYDNSTR